MTYSDATYHEMAALVGVSYVGLQHRRNGDPLPLFNDPVTRTTFTLNEGEDIYHALARKREQFKEE